MLKGFKNLPTPEGMSKAEILDLLQKEEYGYLPQRPYSVTATVKETNTIFCAAGDTVKKITLNCKAEFGEFSFPVYYAHSAKLKKPSPAFIHINFTDLVPDKYQPTEEISDSGYATLTFCYRDVTSDDGDFTNGLAGVLFPDGKRRPHDPGKIALWAWAASAVMDYAITLPELDHGKISVVGHSRLGKTALLAGAVDERFYCAFSNDSGCCGAAISRNKKGETIRDITERFPFWFCENYKKYADNEDMLPFDQHFLVAANIPHRVYVASAKGDIWASPKNEYLSCVAASDYYEAALGVGFIRPERLPKAGEYLHEGYIGYHLRDGVHFLSRHDWQHFIKYLARQLLT